MLNLGKYKLGSYGPGAVVTLAERNTEFKLALPGKTVTVVSNYADGTGVVVIRDKNGAVYERDAHTPLFEIEYNPGWFGK